MFNRHLKENNVGYFQHLVHSMTLAVMSITAGVVFLIHAVMPFIFTDTGSKMIGKIYSKFSYKYPNT